ncbi:hypothetical protein ACOMHN_031191 [Nucella lapillus]
MGADALLTAHAQCPFPAGFLSSGSDVIVRQLIGVELVDCRRYSARPSRANLQNLIKVPLQSSDLPNQLCVCLFNAKSVGVARKRTAIADFLADHNVDVMVLIETWLKESGDESKIADLTPPGYKLFSFPRQLTASIKGGGGIAVIMKDCQIQIQIIY